MIYFLLLLNFVISWANCWSSGRVWAESKAFGGMLRVLALCGAVQSAIGFSSVIGFLVGGLAYQFGLLPPKYAGGAESLWYLLVIIPAIGTGLIITIESWVIAYRERSIANMGVAAYNTFAEIHNTMSAFSGIGDALSGVADMFSSDSDSEGSGSWLLLLAIGIVVVALFSGVMLTWALIKHYAGTLPVPARYPA